MLLFAVNSIVYSCAAQEYVLSGPNIVCKKQSIQMLVNGVVQHGMGWVSSDTKVASVNNNGVVTGITSGTTNITYFTGVNSNYAQPVITVTVNPFVKVGDITFNGESLESYTLLYDSTMKGKDTSNGGTWSSSNTTVATVSGKSNVCTVIGASSGFSTISYTMPTGCYALAPVVVPAPASSHFVPKLSAFTNIEDWHLALANHRKGLLNRQVKQNGTAFVFPANTFDSLINGLNCTDIVFYIGLDTASDSIKLYYSGAYQTGENTYKELRMFNAGGMPVMFDMGYPCPTCGGAGNVHLAGSPKGAEGDFVFSFIYNRALNTHQGTISPIGFIPVPPVTTGGVNVASDTTITYSGRKGWSFDSLNIKDYTAGIDTVYGRVEPVPRQYLTSYTFKSVTGVNSIGIAYDPVVYFNNVRGGTINISLKQQSAKQLDSVIVPMNGAQKLYFIPGQGTKYDSCTISINKNKPIGRLINNTGYTTYTLQNVTEPLLITASFSYSSGSNNGMMNKKR